MFFLVFPETIFICLPSVLGHRKPVPNVLLLQLYSSQNNHKSCQSTLISESLTNITLPHGTPSLTHHIHLLRLVRYFILISRVVAIITFLIDASVTPGALLRLCQQLHCLNLIGIQRIFVSKFTLIIPMIWTIILEVKVITRLWLKDLDSLDSIINRLLRPLQLCLRHLRAGMDSVVRRRNRRSNDSSGIR